jgi:glycosyltransferase involved in cell wall biosynthesis
MESPTVSVVIPYAPEFTPEKLLERAKSTARAQNMPVELIVVEDTESRGPSWARNCGLDQADTRYVALLDADDMWFENKLRRQLNRMDETEAGLCVEGVSMDTESFMRELYLGNLQSLTSSIVLDTNQVNVRFDEELDRREDHLFMLEAASQSGVCLVPDLFEVGRHENSYSHGLTHWVRLKKDIAFARAVQERVPEISEYINCYYRRPRCRTEPVMNTPGDFLRAALIKGSPSVLVFIWVSYICQRFRLWSE